MYYIYTFKNKVNGKVYVGKTNNPKQRNKSHFSIMKNSDKHGFSAIHHAMAKYGEDNFEHTIIAETDTEEKVFELEKYYIKELNSKSPNGYNLTDGGEGVSGLIKNTKFISKDDFEEYFYKHIEKKDNGCWIWAGNTDKVGLPRVKYQTQKWNISLVKNVKQEYSVRRLSLELDKQTLPSFRAHIFSICGDRLCVNPKHLSVGDEARFWSKVDKTGECWLWTGSIDQDGRGKFLVKHGGSEKTLRATRYSYELTYGKIDAGIVITHICASDMCVRPEHLLAKDRDEFYHTMNIKRKEGV